ncbi:cysteine desulfurase family protein [Aquipuribacter nitratireducens]|uniref:Cysteine desulfurase family protein n=1 Tax=Aquipuribacter nitratireducens TaxID=650104 RepID=A0ABW0GKR1_9MICO
MSAYLDHAATTPVRDTALAAWRDAALAGGNPSSLHGPGRRARRAVEDAREQVAAALGVGAAEVVLTAGGTEADNLGVKGLWGARTAADPRRRVVLASPVEHHAVLDCVTWLADARGAEVVWLPVDADGRVDVAGTAALLERDGDRAALLTCMWANNEVGTIQPLAEVVALAHEHEVPVHADAVQAVGWLPEAVGAIGADTVAVSGHKLGAPTGSGALVVRRGTALEPVLHGGGQERGVRSGTVDAPAAAALAVALREAVAEQPDQAPRVAALRDRLAAGLLATDPTAVVQGADPASGGRLPTNLHVTFPGCEGDSLLYLFDAAGVAVSTGSACRAGVPEPSHVLHAMGVAPLLARGALRFSLGRTSTDADVDRVLEVLPAVLERARAAGARSRGAVLAG